MRKQQHRLCVCIAMLVMGAGIRTDAAVIETQTALANFEDYPEGLVGTSFTESHSGIVFTNATYSLGAGIFSVDYGNYGPPYNFPIFPSSILTLAGSSLGPTVSLAGRAGFTATFPFPTTKMEMDVIYSSSDGPSSLTITGFSNTNQQVAQTTYTLPRSNFTYVHEVFTAPSSMQKIVVVPTGISAALGYDNILIGIPEPSTFSLALAMGFCIQIRRCR
jgi:hypothetical protein